MNLGGFAHGSSSMATAIFLLYKQFGDIRYLEAFKHSLLHDRSFYSDKIQGWIDGRNPSYEEDSGSWCHGATGIALSRLILASEGFSDKTMVKELKIAINQIEKELAIIFLFVMVLWEIWKYCTCYLCKMIQKLLDGLIR